ncbi:DNA-binding transcriptional MerR regulator [Murinocardiopsis flavida]|uniref:DNA-binding transcriptional MerR regulator n=1 Tax=Murinocardiopsis flavida TaxID=645275 RepID=A0A2P8D941_9ACTN|nr:MerR family transcriptional regulator [Murinocardiopsis flavida]PSK93729.1 DNA-binding transcriptional MerR regulator [Murinocardiopsis flavida]
MLSINDFSQMCRLSPQTLRFYHSEGLLVPDHVNEQTGYRYYEFAQVETAMLVMALRGAGMSVRLVRRALDAPDTVLDLLRQHEAELRSERLAQDEALRDARELFTADRRTRQGTAPAVTAVSKALPPSDAQDGDVLDKDIAHALAAADEVGRAVAECGAAVAGSPWMTWSADAEGRRAPLAHNLAWMVVVPVHADGGVPAGLPEGMDLRHLPEREERSMTLPGRGSMAKYSTAIGHLYTPPDAPDGLFPDSGSLRYILHPESLEVAMTLYPLDRLPGADEDDGGAEAPSA